MVQREVYLLIHDMKLGLKADIIILRPNLLFVVLSHFDLATDFG